MKKRRECNYCGEPVPHKKIISSKLDHIVCPNCNKSNQLAKSTQWIWFFSIFLIIFISGVIYNLDHSYLITVTLNALICLPLIAMIYLFTVKLVE
ncbi:hypothetical protein [Halobacillus sp. BBL2006]|uniref:hypothetical protein n=1 Tax=Halobacillus sp. BBL2006 TaxID=1543706 RepID=UPI0005426F6D|nr:hypothetical protein [Halobacillus sp. BBL2006]KHE70677.1 hypothetical protein LD39_11340 [Halobacillus sp. BBL2006]